MAKVEWSAGIDSVSGALAKPGANPQHSCNKMLLGTHRVAETTSPDCNRLYLRKKTKRSTPVKDTELEVRTKFAAVSRLVQARKNNLSTLSSDQEAYAAQRNEPGGKKTWKAYLWKICKEQYAESSH